MSCRTFPERKGEGVPRATVGHMPFAGHRTCAEWGEGKHSKTFLSRAKEYGYDPESLKAARR